jgi:hypothetical protein
LAGGAVLFELISARLRAPQPAHHGKPAIRQLGWDLPGQGYDVAAIDRLVHHAVILEMNADSYRRNAAITRMSDQTGVTNTTPQPADKKPNRRVRDN